MSRDTVNTKVLPFCSKSFDTPQKYGAFSIHENIATWNHDNTINLDLEPSSSEFCLHETLWLPDGQNKEDSYGISLAGVCLWNKYDCLFCMEKKDRGNPGAIRSLGNPKDQIDLIKRLKSGQKVEKILISSDPFGDYQLKTIGWQAHIVKKFNVKKMYYIIPIHEYIRVISNIQNYLTDYMVYEIKFFLENHHQLIKNHIQKTILTEIEFLYPLDIYPDMTIEASYQWPYENLDIDLGIEEMEEIRIPYQVRAKGKNVPPIMLGLLDFPTPYNQKRIYHEKSRQHTIHTEELGNSYVAAS